MLNTAFASTVPSDLRIGDTYPTGTGFGGFVIPDIPPYDQFALVCVCVPSHVTVKLDSFTRGPPALTNAESSKFLPVAVDEVDVAVVVQDAVPPPKVMPGFETGWAVACVGPFSEHCPCVGTSTVVPALVNDADPMLATPGWGAAEAGEATKGAANAAARVVVTIVVRMSLSSRRPGPLPR